MCVEPFFRDKPGYPVSETISCPECGHIEKAEVHFYEGDIWPSAVHECSQCGYIIMESEWAEVKKKEQP